ncbi:uncharacterized protein LOC134675776 [Cydia fagiglandana]|uniref:uncharacterized protein LOC134675776 n=1 Tax=Cydia fagiglandana TaxID=1458189 RepID=UPI002FEDFDFD
MSANTCSGCGEPLPGSEFLKCFGCQDKYDLICLGIEQAAFLKLSKDQKEQWNCPSCTCSRPKGDNTHTPIRSSAALLRTEVMALKEQNSEISLLRQDVQELKAQLAKATTHTESLKELEKKLSMQQSSITELTDALEQLQQSYNTHEQNNLHDELEIAGIEESDNENLHHIALVMSSKLGVALTDAEVSQVFRTGARRRLSNVTVPGKRQQPRPIVVKLTRRSKRDELVKAARNRRHFTSEDIVAGMVTKVYLNERLTKHNRALFHAARQRSSQYHYRYCWTSNGLIYVRKAEGKPALQIRSLPELDLRVGPANSDPSMEQQLDTDSAQ